MEEEEVREFLLLAEDAISTVQLSCESGSQDFEGMLLQVELLVRDVVLLEGLVQYEAGEAIFGDAILQAVVEVARAIQDLTDEYQRNHTRGRPEIPISAEDLAVLLEYRFTIRAIARMFQVSPKTIRRRIIRYGMDEDLSFSDISDSQLDSITQQFVHAHPVSGQRSLDGFFRGVGLKVQRYRLRESLRRVDPRGVRNRLRQALHRRRYSVRMPNSLWHIDGYHKLVRWRIIIRGGIDGYSRLPVFLSASTNNTADTVLQCFLNGVHQYGLPSRVRCDRGGENVMVSQFMLSHPRRGPGRGSCITGRSVHNQRIERFWRDLFMGCVFLFYTLFYTMEDMGILDPASNTDLFALHHVFLPRINHSLNVFQESYGHHRLRTAGNRTPYQLWISGLAERSGDDLAVEGVLEEPLVSLLHGRRVCAFGVHAYMNVVICFTRIGMALTGTVQQWLKMTPRLWRSHSHIILSVLTISMH